MATLLWLVVGLALPSACAYGDGPEPMRVGVNDMIGDAKALIDMLNSEPTPTPEPYVNPYNPYTPGKSIYTGNRFMTKQQVATPWQDFLRVVEQEAALTDKLTGNKNMRKPNPPVVMPMREADAGRHEREVSLLDTQLKKHRDRMEAHRIRDMETKLKKEITQELKQEEQKLIEQLETIKNETFTASDRDVQVTWQDSAELSEYTEAVWELLLRAGCKGRWRRMYNGPNYGVTIKALNASTIYCLKLRGIDKSAKVVYAREKLEKMNAFVTWAINKRDSAAGLYKLSLYDRADKMVQKGQALADAQEAHMQMLLDSETSKPTFYTTADYTGPPCEPPPGCFFAGNSTTNFTCPELPPCNNSNTSNTSNTSTKCKPVVEDEGIQIGAELEERATNKRVVRGGPQLEPSPAPSPELYDMVWGNKSLSAAVATQAMDNQFLIKHSLL